MKLKKQNKAKCEEPKVGNSPKVLQQVNGETYAMEYYAAVKKEELLLYATIWMGLKGIMLVTDPVPENYMLFDGPIHKSEKDKMIVTEDRLILAIGLLKG